MLKYDKKGLLHNNYVMYETIVKGLKNPQKVPGYCREKIERKRSERWCSKKAVAIEEYAHEIDTELWEESKQYAEELETTLQEQYEGIATTNFHDKVGVGGGAAFTLLYFLTRVREPETVVETGVAAGWSSRAILDALHENGSGCLYSNDLPYSERPSKQEILHLDEDHIGILVDRDLRDRWELRLGSDRENLPQLVENINSIDMVHYDSDKSYEGRRFAMRLMKDKLHSDSVVLMDDIEDNLFFRDLTFETSIDHTVVEPIKSKYVGIINEPW